MSEINKIRLSGTDYDIRDVSATSVVELTQQQYNDLPATAKTDNILYIITDAQAGDLTNYYTKTETNTLLGDKQDTLVSGTNIKTINNESILGSGNINIQGGGVNVVQTTGTSTTDVMSQDAVTTQLKNKASKSQAVGSYSFGETDNAPFITLKKVDTAQSLNEIYYPKINGKGILSTNSTWAKNNLIFSLVDTSAITTSVTSSSTDAQVPSAKAVYDAIQDSLSGYVTTDTEQVITAQKTFVGDPNNKKKSIKFKQYDNASKVGFTIVNSAETNNELASFELRPNTFTIDGVKHPLLYFGHYRTTAIANAGVPQTVIGYRQYDQKNAAAYHYLIPLPEKAKTPFSLTTSFKDYYAPIGFKNGSTMITADDTGVVDLSSELGGLKLVKLTQSEYDALSTKDSNTLYVING